MYWTVWINDTECGIYPCTYESEEERSEAIACFSKNHPDWTFRLVDPVPVTGDDDYDLFNGDI